MTGTVRDAARRGARKAAGAMKTSTVRINTSDTEWLRRHAAEDDVIPYGTDIKGIAYFQAEVTVWQVERVTFAGAKMIRFEFYGDAPADHAGRSAMYPESYLVSE